MPYCPTAVLICHGIVLISMVICADIKRSMWADLSDELTIDFLQQVMFKFIAGFMFALDTSASRASLLKKRRLQRKDSPRKKIHIPGAVGSHDGKLSPKKPLAIEMGKTSSLICF